MADNVTYATGVGATPANATVIKTDELSGAHAQVIKLVMGADGTDNGYFDKATTPVVYNVTLTNANTEYTQALPSACKSLTFKCRTAYAVRYAWETGKVATPTAPYMTLQAGEVWSNDHLNFTSKTLYLASATAGVIVEMEAMS